MTTSAPPASAPVNKFNPNKPAASLAELSAFLKANVDSIRRVAAHAMDPFRMVAIMGAAASRSPLLIKCTPLSLLRCLAQGAELGLEVAGGLQEFHPVPYWNSDLGCYEAQGIPGYPGLAKLVLQTGEVVRLLPQVVYKTDLFDYEYGDKPFLKHKPDLDKLGDDQPDSEIRAFYCVAFYKDGSSIFEVMGVGAVNKLRDRVEAKKKTKGQGPWFTDYAQMGIKTALRRLAKRLPKTPALAKALDLQAQAEAGEFQTSAILAQVPALPGAGQPDLDGQALPQEALSGDAQSSQPKTYIMGEALSEKQIGAARIAAGKLGLKPDGVERVLATVSNLPKAEARKFIDTVFAKDDAKTRPLFEQHPEYPEPPAAPAAADAPGSTEGEPPEMPPPPDHE